MVARKVWKEGEVLTAADLNNYTNGGVATHVPFAMAAGVQTMSSDVQTVPLPSGRFTRAPIVVATVATGSGNVGWNTVKVFNTTQYEFKLWLSGSAGATVNWVAVQMDA